MTTQQIQYFIKLAEDLNFTSVANYFFITQPTLSRQISNLETELEFPLFAREKNRVFLTAEGKLFYEKILPFYGQLQSSVEEIRNLYQRNYQSLNIGVMDEQIMNTEILLVLNQLRMQNPDVMYHFYREGHAVLVEKLLEGTCSLINVLKMPQDNLDSSCFPFLLLAEESTYIAIHRSLSADLPDIISRELLGELFNQHPLILPKIKMPAGFDPLEELSKAMGISFEGMKIRHIFESNPLSVPMNIIAKQGFAITNESNLFYADPQIRVIEIAGASKYKKGIYYNAQSGNPVLDTFIEKIHFLLAEKNELSL